MNENFKFLVEQAEDLLRGVKVSFPESSNFFKKVNAIYEHLQFIQAKYRSMVTKYCVLTEVWRYLQKNPENAFVMLDNYMVACDSEGDRFWESLDKKPVSEVAEILLAYKRAPAVSDKYHESHIALFQEHGL